jgi:hypothetical protein
VIEDVPPPPRNMSIRNKRLFGHIVVTVVVTELPFVSVPMAFENALVPYGAGKLTFV